MSAHRCEGCTRLYYPSEGESALRCDAILVGLSKREILLAQTEGRRRVTQNRAYGVKHKFGGERYGTLQAQTEQSIQAAAAEIAVCRIFDKPWTGKGQAGLDRPDCGPYEVRSTVKGRRAAFHLGPDRPRDPKAKDHPGVYICTRGAIPAITIVGWARLPEDTAGRWLEYPPNDIYRRTSAYFIWHSDLHDLRRLPERAAWR
jgi:hypothetical protein